MKVAAACCRCSCGGAASTSGSNPGLKSLRQVVQKMRDTEYVLSTLINWLTITAEKMSPSVEDYDFQENSLQ